MIRIDHLNFLIAKRLILKNVNLSLPKGSFTALMGPNGSGKTTLLKCITTLNKPTSGTIRIHDKLQQNYTAKEFSHQIAYLPQERFMLFDLKAYDMVMMGRYPYQKPLEPATNNDALIVQEAMIKTDTWHLKNRNVQYLSGGEFQRLSLAQALAQQTSILLLDEPLSNLDLLHQKEIMNLLQTINQTDDKTILLIIHDLNMALHYCPETVLLKEGEILYHGKTEHVLSNAPIKDTFGIETKLLDVSNYKMLTII